MESEDNRDHLNKPALEKIVFSAFVMAGIDGHVDEDEVEVIRNFTSRHWKDEYGG
ncbi:MAG: hypothetical protein GY866_42765, partial [Proteobacteria bacterium]|nr:hypothetical protein [Pseudomonadota bacterium]